MDKRFWFYLGVLIVIAGEISYYRATQNRIAQELARLNLSAQEQRINDLKNYLGRQTDERKLVSLAKKLRFSEAKTLQLIIDRAYELNPNSRDITLLASEFHPELKERVKELDPLYAGTKQ